MELNRENIQKMKLGEILSTIEKLVTGGDLFMFVILCQSLTSQQLLTLKMFGHTIIEMADRELERLEDEEDEVQH